MHPVITVLRFAGVERPIGSYGVLMSLAIFVAATITTRAAARSKLDVGATIATVGFTSGGALAGSYVVFAIVEWVRTGSFTHPLMQPGLVFFGAPLGGGLAFWLACRKLELPAGRLVDLAIPALPAAHAVGRLGCFLGGCCFGRPFSGPWSVTYLSPLAPAAYPPICRHPVPLYESAALLLLAAVFAAVPLGHVGRGRRLMAYLASYGVVRIVTETFRGDSVRGVLLGGMLSTSQMIAAVVVAGSVLALWLTRGPVADRSRPV